MRFAKDLFWYTKDKPFSHILGMGLSCNVFVIDQGQELWMIDAGSGSLGRVKHLLRFIRQDNLTGKPLSKIFLTHTHPDHAAAIPKLRKEYPDMEIYAHSEDLPTLYRGANIFWQDEKEASGSFFHVLYPVPSFLLKIITYYFFGRFPKIQQVHPLRHGQIIRGNKYNLQIFHTPGHTPGHCAFFIPSAGVLFTGDLIETFSANTPSMNLAVANFDKYLNSVRSLLKLDVLYLCAAHGLKIHEGLIPNKNRIMQCEHYMLEGKQTILSVLKSAYPKAVSLRKLSRSVFLDKYPNRRRFAILSILNDLQASGLVQLDDHRFICSNPY